MALGYIQTALVTMQKVNIPKRDHDVLFPLAWSVGLWRTSEFQELLCIHDARCHSSLASEVLAGHISSGEK